MAAPISLGTIRCSAGQKFAWTIRLKRNGSPFPTTGCGVFCQIRATVQPAHPLVVPTIERDDANGAVTFSVSEAQALLLHASGTAFTTPTRYFVEIDFAYADSPTEPTIRFWVVIEVFPGGMA